MNKIAWIPVFWPLIFAVICVSAYSPDDHTDPTEELIGTWHLSAMTTVPSAVLSAYSLTLKPEGNLVVVCPEAINAAKWSWKDDSFLFHISATDPVLNSLGKFWKVVRHDESTLVLADAMGLQTLHMVRSR